MITRLSFFGFLMLIISIGCTTSKVTGPIYEGAWHYTFPTQDGSEMDAVMTITKEGSGYAGVLTSEMGSIDIDDLKIEDGSMSGSITIETYVIELSGTFDGDLYHGVTSVEGMEFPMEATRKK